MFRPRALILFVVLCLVPVVVLGQRQPRELSGSVSDPQDRFVPSKLNLAVDNLLNKKYYETQNYFESRTCPDCTVFPRVHATPGYPFTLSLGATFTIGTKN